MLRRAAIVVPAGVLLLAGWQRRWTTDDGFINFRIVRMLLDGHGPVFNAGERVEAYTSPLWVAVLALGDVVLPVRLEHVAVVCSLALAAAGVAALCTGSMRLLQRSGDRTWVPFGAVVLVALPPVWDFATSGLEFGLTLGWLGAVMVVLGRWATADRPLIAAEAVLVGLGPLVRPDAALYTAAVLAVVVAGRWRDEGARQRIMVLACAAALPVAYQLFRMAYFAAVVPNTVLAKAGDVAHWREGWAYVWNLLRPYGLYLPLALVVAGGIVAVRPLDRRRRLAAAALPTAGLLHALAIVRAGGDYQHARLLLPSLVAVIAPVAVLPVRRALLAPLAATVVWAAVAAVGLRVHGVDTVGRTLIADGREAVVDFLGVDNPVTTDDLGWGDGGPDVLPIGDGGLWVDGERLDAAARPGVAEPTVVLRGIGVGGYALGSDVYVFDRLGLAHPLVSRFDLDRPGFVGHEKPVPAAWVAALLTDDDLAPGFLGDEVFAVPLHESTVDGFDADVVAARTALDCGRLRDLHEATTGPLGAGRLLANLWRSVGLSLLRVPPDPVEAADELC